MVGIGVGALAVAFGAFVLHGRTIFAKSIRVVPALDLGTQRLSMEAGAAWGQGVQVRVQQDPESNPLPGPRKTHLERRTVHERHGSHTPRTVSDRS
jgi:hypothetical protein